LPRTLDFRLRLLLTPKYLALDSSHLGQWVRERLSNNTVDRAEAISFEAWLDRSGYVLLLCLHHVVELANYQNEQVALARLRFLARRPFVAWIGSPDDKRLGEITTLFAEEVRAAMTAPGIPATAVRDLAKAGLIHVGSGQDLLGIAPERWLTLRAELARLAEQARKVVAFTRTNLVDIGQMPMAKLLSGRVRKGEELRRQLDLMTGSFAVDIARRGDRRIEDPRAMAEDFVGEMMTLAGAAGTSAPELVFRLLALQGVTAADILPNSTVRDMLTLGLFRSQLRISCEIIGMDYRTAVGAIQPEQLPSWQITKALERHLPDVPERKGSELTDTHLVCLAAYADVSLVDRRTLEGIRRLRRKEPVSSSLLGRVERASSYREIPYLLSES
jgi:hypothetical protein